MDMEEERHSSGGARCDNCDEATALLYCRADSAKLCFGCDRHVHSANKLFSNHTRSQLCHSCLESPASIFCSTDASLLCHDCDWDAHRSHHSSALHRRPLEGFSGCPSVSEFLAIFGFDDLDKKALLGDDGYDCDDFLVCDVLNFDDVIVSDSDTTRFQAMCVPPLPKNRNAVCGKHTDEVLRQLRELARKESDSIHDNVSGFEALVPQQAVDPGLHEDDDTFRQFEGHSCLWFDNILGQERVPEMFGIYVEEGCRDSEKHSDVGDCSNNANIDLVEQSPHPLDSKASASLQKVAPYELSSQERETAISRYKEKRKVRRFDKHIRYESRKVRAESRTRIKGRFAKIEH